MNERKMTKVKEQASERPYKVIHILSDINRMQILRLLADRGELCARDILSFFPITQPTLSHHMNVLLENNLVEARKSGRWVFYHLSNNGIQDIIDFFEALKKNSKNLQAQVPKEPAPRKMSRKPRAGTEPRTKVTPSPAAASHTPPRTPSFSEVSEASGVSEVSGVSLVSEIIPEKAAAAVPFAAPVKNSDFPETKKSKKKDKEKADKKDKKKGKKNKKNK